MSGADISDFGTKLQRYLKSYSSYMPVDVYFR